MAEARFSDPHTREYEEWILKLTIIPAGLTQGQVFDVLLRRLKDHPDDRHFTLHSVAAHAFIAKLGCSIDEKPWTIPSIGVRQ